MLLKSSSDFYVKLVVFKEHTFQFKVYLSINNYSQLTFLPLVIVILWFFSLALYY